jgi:hypothetical protein
MVLLNITEFVLETGGVHLFCEKLDVLDRAYHIMGDGRMQHFHHVILLAFFFKLQVVGNVTEKHKQALLVFVKKFLTAQQVMPHPFLSK